MRILKYKKTDRARHKGAKKHAQNSERVKIHVSTGDTVKVVRGDDKGHVGKVMRVYRKTGRVVVEGANFVKRHRKARTADEQGGIVSFEAPIHSSNVMLLDPKSDAPTRTRRRIDTDGTKERLAVKSGEAIPRVR
jgi:large subunit ribosomal protein L24